jgi:hypothetical protein
MNGLMDIGQPAAEHHWLWQEPGGPQLYLLLCDGARVTLRSQQIRAMNLAWALRERLESRPCVAVIGGGGAGITFAAAAAHIGASVTLYESHRLMHLQQGSWHRPLHPEIYTWPDDTAFRPVSHLPLLGWTTGTAHDVATEIVAKFRSLAHELGEARLKIREGVRVMLDRLGRPRGNDVSDNESASFNLIVIATGFGIESGPSGLALNSYWRSDSLDQPFLEPSRSSVVISGSGDGGLIELLRVCVQETDQAPFLDFILAETLLDTNLLGELRKLDAAELERGRGAEVEEGLKQLTKGRFGSLQVIDRFLSQRRRKGVVIQWLFTTAHPFDVPSLLINRFLASRLLQPDMEFDVIRHACVPKESPAVSMRDGGKVLIEYPGIPLDCDHAVFRWGAQKTMRRVGKFETPPLLQSVNSVFEDPSEEQLRTLAMFLSRDRREHSRCNRPQGWPDERGFLMSPYEPLGPPPSAPRLLAEFVMAFDSPDDRAAPDRPMVFRIRTWLVGLAPRMLARYDLHPENHKPITRVGIGQFQRQWINTRNDYSIRVRTADGREWSDYSVLGALTARYDLDAALDQESGASPGSRQPMPVRKKRGAEFVGAGTMTAQTALEVLDKQTRRRAQMQPR